MQRLRLRLLLFYVSTLCVLIVPSLASAASSDFWLYLNQCPNKGGKLYQYGYAKLEVPNNASKVTVTRYCALYEDLVRVFVNGTEVYKVPPDTWYSCFFDKYNAFHGCFDLELEITDLVNEGANEIYGYFTHSPGCMEMCLMAGVKIHIETGECADNDGDGYNGKSAACPSGNDCNDDPANGGGGIHPGADEICDNKDNDCDGEIDEGCCGASIASVPSLIRQCDSRWKDSQYDNADGTICRWGCALSSLNMLMNSKGCYPDFLATNNCSSCFDPGGKIYFGAVLNKYCPIASYLENEKKDYGFFKTVESVLAETPIDDDLINGYNYILRVAGSGGGCTHFVFATGVTDDCKKFKVLDPNQHGSEVSKICGYRKFK